MFFQHVIRHIAKYIHDLESSEYTPQPVDSALKPRLLITYSCKFTLHSLLIHDKEAVANWNACILRAVATGQRPSCPGGNMNDIGRILKEGRMARGLDINDIARTTCISTRYLQAMEEGRFQNIPTVFDKGYLKIYANLLHIDTKPLLALYELNKSKP